MKPDPSRFVDTEVKTYSRVLKCAVTGCDGEMRSIGEGFTTWDTEWKHQCSKCGVYESITNVTFPTTIHKPAAGESK